MEILKKMCHMRQNSHL